jgi:hypothetical protein
VAPSPAGEGLASSGRENSQTVGPMEFVSLRPVPTEHTAPAPALLRGCVILCIHPSLCRPYNWSLCGLSPGSPQGRG